MLLATSGPDPSLNNSKGVSPNESAVSELSSWRGPCTCTARDGAGVSSEGRRQAVRRGKPTQLCEPRFQQDQNPEKTIKRPRPGSGTPDLLAVPDECDHRLGHLLSGGLCELSDPIGNQALVGRKELAGPSETGPKKGALCKVLLRELDRLRIGIGIAGDLTEEEIVPSNRRQNQCRSTL